MSVAFTGQMNAWCEEMIPHVNQVSFEVWEAQHEPWWEGEWDRLEQAYDDACERIYTDPYDEGDDEEEPAYDEEREEEYDEEEIACTRIHYFHLAWWFGTTWWPCLEVWRCGWEPSPYPWWLRAGMRLWVMELRECHFCGKCATVARLQAEHGMDWLPDELR